MNEQPEKHGSMIVPAFARIVEWGNDWLTLSRMLFRKKRGIFVKVEILMILITLLCIGLLLFIDLIPFKIAVVIGIILVQRVLEFLIIYSRNFILTRGLIFTRFKDETKLGEWLILMFGMSITQIVLVFAIWYRLISFYDPNAFSQPIGILDSLYFSIVTFTTIGFGDIIPVSTLPKVLVIFQTFLTFFTIVVVINGLVSIHYVKLSRQKKVE